MKKLLGLFVLVAIAGACAWRIMELRKTRGSDGRADGKRAPVPVLLATVVHKAMPVEIRTFGTVEASTTVTVRAQVTGTLAELGFAEGEEVKAGQLLCRIAPRPFAADLRQAEAALARTEAQLTNAVTEARRVSELFDKKLVSESERDLALTAVAILRATARADAANVENARIRLDYCEIHSPIAGSAGRRLVDAGNLVTANATALVTINQVQPVAVGFTIPQQELARVRGRTGARELVVEAMLPEGASGPETGVLTFMDNAVDRTTGTLALKAQFPNDSRRLWPGQFVAVRMVVAVESNAVVIPYRAVQNGQNGTYVYVVQADASVTNRLVKIARLVEDESVVEEGLQPGELVVADGQQRVGPGSIVKDAAAGNPGPGVRNPESGTRNPESGTRNPESGVRSAASGTRSPGHSAP